MSNPQPSQRNSDFVSSHALDDSFTEDAVGANHQGEDHEDVGGEVFGAAADVGVDVAGRDVLDDADDEASDDRARDRIQSRIA